MSAAVLRILQARAEFVPVLRRQPVAQSVPCVHASAEVPTLRPPRPQLGFYRKYTEAMLRRYVRMSMEVGRVPSPLGGEMFRAKVSNYRMESFEDVVIFCHDVERSLERLSPNQQSLIDRIALKQYTVNETAEMLRTCPRTIIRQYNRGLDRLTAVFIEAQLLNPSKCCQAPQAVENPATGCNENSYKIHFDVI